MLVPAGLRFMGGIDLRWVAGTFSVSTRTAGVAQLRSTSPCGVRAAKPRCSACTGCSSSVWTAGGFFVGVFLCAGDCKSAAAAADCSAENRSTAIAGLLVDVALSRGVFCVFTFSYSTPLAELQNRVARQVLVQAPGVPKACGSQDQ